MHHLPPYDFLQGAPVMLFAQDSDTTPLWIMNAPYGLDAEQFINATDGAVVDFSSGETLMRAKQRVLETGTPFNGEIAVKFPQGEHRYELWIHKNKHEGLSCVALDITARAPGGHVLRNLKLELAHRAKNLMAVVRSLAAQTARRAQSVPGFIDEFSGRIDCLARLHDALAANSWEGVFLIEMAHTQIEPLLPEAALLVSPEAEYVFLTPHTAQNLALALHELAAAADPEGEASLRLERDESGLVTLHWRCQYLLGVRPIWAQLLERITPQSLGGPTILEPHGEGLRCTLSLTPEHYR